MKCYHHPGLEAVGICKFCSKGLCAGCAADLGHGLACKGEHEGEVTALYQRLPGENRPPLDASAPDGRTAWYSIGISLAAGGALIGYAATLAQQGLAGLAYALGAAFLAFSALLYGQHRKGWRRTP